MLTTREIQKALCNRYKINAIEATKFITGERACASEAGRPFTFEDAEALNTWLSEMEALGK